VDDLEVSLGADAGHAVGIALLLEAEERGDGKPSRANHNDNGSDAALRSPVRQLVGVISPCTWARSRRFVLLDQGVTQYVRSPQLVVNRNVA
jgi:hypothetical protein